MTRKGISIFSSILALSVAAGCGGGGASGGGGPVARDARGRTVRTATGAEVTQEAHDRWTEGLALFTRAEGQGWNGARCDEAVQKFEAAIEAQGGRFVEARYMAGAVSARCNRNDAARTYYEQALQMNEHYCPARNGLGVLLMDAGRQQEAFATFQRALTDDSRCTEAYVNVAVIQRQRGGNDVREALNNLRRALAIDAQYLPAFNQMALLYLDAAIARDNPQMLDLAGVVCRQAQLIDRDYAPIYNTWGLINVRQENLIEALQLFERATRLDNTIFEAYMNFGEITQSFRGYEDSRRAFGRAVELRGDSYEAHIGLGASLRGLNQLPAAQAEYERAIQIDANRPEAYFNLGILYQDYMSGSIEDLERAKRYYGQFVSKAGREARFAEAVENIQRSCRVQRPQGRRRHRARSDDCRPGRVQNINTALEALTAAAEMQRQMDQRSRQQGGSP